MGRGLNFRTQEGQEAYAAAYNETLRLWDVPYEEKYVETAFGATHCLVSGNTSGCPLVLLHAASCGATIWYPNVASFGQDYRLYAIDLITEPSKSVLTSKIKTPRECAEWLEQTLDGLGLDEVFLCGLSVGGWHATNYALSCPDRVKALVLLSPIQTLTHMHLGFFAKIMRMGLNPTRKSVEAYTGWGRSSEAPLPDSVIKQFTISVMNVSPNSAFPKMIPKERLRSLKMPVLILLGENEFAFNVRKAVSVANMMIGSNLSIDVLQNGSHLISVSLPSITNERVLRFLNDNN